MQELPHVFGEVGEAGPCQFAQPCVSFNGDGFRCRRMSCGDEPGGKLGLRVHNHFVLAMANSGNPKVLGSPLVANRRFVPNGIETWRTARHRQSCT